VKTTGKVTFLKRFLWFIERADDWVNAVVAVTLLGLAVAIILNTLYKAIGGVTGNVFESTSYILDRLLLVLIVLEILWTIITYLESHKVPLEPFLYVGIITSIRKLLIIGAEAEIAHLRENLQYIAIDMGINVTVIIVLVIGLYLIRKSRFLYVQKENRDFQLTVDQEEETKQGGK
jgi:uncharacterized membrane protein (DUF373 family)